MLLHHAAVLDGDHRSARAHLESAVALRDQLADALPEDVRRRFLARRNLVTLGLALERLQASDGVLVGADPQTPATGVVQPPGGAAETAPRPAVTMGRPRRTPARTTASQSTGPASRSSVPALRRMVGRTPAMLALAGAVLKVGPCDATVLVYGESGTGKELVAEAIHEASPRRAGPLVKVNCAALVETLLLSELFGHEKGSFTGATARRQGRFELAEGGTIFLDEIGDISPRTQVALLRVLQDRTFERVGGVTPIRANVRIVCATHRDLGSMVSRGDFREDLYYRLRGFVLEVPALRQRIADLPHIAGAILDQIAAERGTRLQRLSPAALEGLGHHPWPGNVRELENALRAAALFAETDVIELEDLTANVVSLHGLGLPANRPSPQAAVRDLCDDVDSAPAEAPQTLGRAGAGIDDLPPISQPMTLASPEIIDPGTDAASDVSAMTQPSKIAHLGSSEAPGSTTDVAYAAIRAGVSLSDLKRDIERDCIARALAETGGNITRAATLLGMKRPRLSQLVKQYGFGAVDAGTRGEVDGKTEKGELIMGGGGGGLKARFRHSLFEV